MSEPVLSGRQVHAQEARAKCPGCGSPNCAWKRLECEKPVPPNWREPE